MVSYFLNYDSSGIFETDEATQDQSGSHDGPSRH